MGERRVSIIIGSGCDTPWVHQNLLIQLSADNEWIPAKPIRFPPPSKNETGSPRVSLDDVAIALGNSLRRNAARRGSPVQNVSGPHNAPGAGKGLDKNNLDKKGKPIPKGAKWPEQQREIVFYARDEVNVGLSGDGGRTQLTIKVKVDPGPGNFRIKKLKPNDVRSAYYGQEIVGRRGKKKRKGSVVGGGWPYFPEYVPHGTIPLGPDEGTDGWEELFNTDYRPGGNSVGVLASVAGNGWGENDFGPEALSFDGGGLTDVRGEHAQAGVYYADGFYYPMDTMDIRDGADIQLENVGMIDADSPTQLDFRSLDPVDPVAALPFVRELAPVSPPAIRQVPPTPSERTFDRQAMESQAFDGADRADLRGLTPSGQPAPGWGSPSNVPDASVLRGITPNGAVRPGAREPLD